jgi:ankyrin repeat protein
MQYMPIFVQNYFIPVATASPATLDSGQDQHCQVKRDSFQRVRNIYELTLQLKQDPHSEKWLFSAADGPFRALGEKKIQAIVDASTKETVLYKLNSALFNSNRHIFEEILSCMRSAQSAQDLHQHITETSLSINLSKMYDGSAKTLLTHAINMALSDPSKLFLIDMLQKMGVNINRLIFSSGEGVNQITPLTYVWDQKDFYKNGTASAIAISNRLLSLGAKLDVTFMSNKNNIAGYLISRQQICEEGGGFKEFLNWYLANKGEINFEDIEGNTLLAQFFLATNEWYSASSSLIANGANVVHANHKGEHPIHLLCENGYDGTKNAEILACVLKEAPQELRVRDDAGHTPLYLCLQGGKLKLTQALFAAWDKQSCFDSSKELLFILMQFIKEHRSFDAEKMKEQIDKRYMPLLKLLLEFCAHTKEEQRHLLIESDGEGNVMLHHLASAVPLILPELLSKNYITAEDLKIVNSQGFSVQQIAVKTENTLAFLDGCLKVNVDVVMHWIEYFDKLDQQLIKEQNLLQKVIYQVNSIWNDAPQPTVAVWHSGYAIFEQLLQSGLDPNCQDGEGNTPLIVAIRVQCELADDIIFKLLDFQANPSIKNHNGINALGAFDCSAPWNSHLARQAVLGAMKA